MENFWFFLVCFKIYYDYEFGCSKEVGYGGYGVFYCLGEKCSFILFMGIWFVT